MKILKFLKLKLPKIFKISLICFLFFGIFQIAFSFELFKKKAKPVLFLSNSEQNLEKEILENVHGTDVFEVNERIYFLVYVPDGFKSDYIKYQIVKQDDKAHVAGYSRVRNKTCRLKNSKYYEDYFVLSEAGKYFIQIFDITNLNQWVAFGGFLVVSK